MALLILYFIVSTIVSRYLEKKMKKANIVFTVVFIYVEIYLLILCDEKIIVNALQSILGSYNYVLFKNILLQSISSNMPGISIFITLQTIIFLSAIITFIVGAVKVINKEIIYFDKLLTYYKDYNLTLKINKPIIKNYISNNYVKKYCRLLY